MLADNRDVYQRHREQRPRTLAAAARGVQTIIAGRSRKGALEQGPEDAIEDTTVVGPRDATLLVRLHGLDGND